MIGDGPRSILAGRRDGVPTVVDGHLYVLP